jgi:hypothetical protein
VNKIKVGEGMDFYVENPKQFKPCSVVLSLGSDILMSFREIKTNFKTDIVIPKQSLILLMDNKEKIYQQVCRKPATITLWI